MRKSWATARKIPYAKGRIKHRIRFSCKEIEIKEQLMIQMTDHFVLG